MSTGKWTMKARRRTKIFYTFNGQVEKLKAEEPEVIAFLRKALDEQRAIGNGIQSQNGDDSEKHELEIEISKFKKTQRGIEAENENSKRRLLKNALSEVEGRNQDLKKENANLKERKCNVRGGKGELQKEIQRLRELLNEVQRGNYELKTASAKAQNEANGALQEEKRCVEVQLTLLKMREHRFDALEAGVENERSKQAKEMGELRTTVHSLERQKGEDDRYARRLRKDLDAVRAAMTDLETMNKAFQLQLATESKIDYFVEDHTCDCTYALLQTR
ncbi:unnamed protein product [Phytophthora lilii]|uniref:Unnamed protein product n=1 Tax=Phytophthora lilii TaxID=2077276 RepID=A0A9W6TZX7_9STRA|nr:unnamed protein product [Phytophthora lilii]